MVLVTVAGAIVHRPLSNVPENAMKFIVGAMLATFGIFWGSEGVGVAWPGSDGAILAIPGLCAAGGARRRAGPAAHPWATQAERASVVAGAAK